MSFIPHGLNKRRGKKQTCEEKKTRRRQEKKTWRRNDDRNKSLTGKEGNRLTMIPVHETTHQKNPLHISLLQQQKLTEKKQDISFLQGVMDKTKRLLSLVFLTSSASSSLFSLLFSLPFFFMMTDVCFFGVGKGKVLQQNSLMMENREQKLVHVLNPLGKLRNNNCHWKGNSGWTSLLMNNTSNAFNRLWVMIVFPSSLVLFTDFSHFSLCLDFGKECSRTTNARKMRW